MRKIIFVYVAIIVILLGFALYRFDVFSPSKSNTNQSRVVVNEKEFQVKLAKTQKEKEIGLSNNKTLEDNKGMLFIFDEPGTYPFWMKNMNFAIDMIFLKDNKVVTVYKNVNPPAQNESPQVYQPTDPANRVLEVKAGVADEIKIQEGTTVTYENIGN